MALIRCKICGLLLGKAEGDFSITCPLCLQLVVEIRQSCDPRSETDYDIYGWEYAVQKSIHIYRDLSQRWANLFTNSMPWR